MLGQENSMEEGVQGCVESLLTLADQALNGTKDLSDMETTMQENNKKQSVKETSGEAVNTVNQTEKNVSEPLKEAEDGASKETTNQSSTDTTSKDMAIGKAIKSNVKTSKPVKAKTPKGCGRIDSYFKPAKALPQIAPQQPNGETSVTDCSTNNDEIVQTIKEEVIEDNSELLLSELQQMCQDTANNDESVGLDKSENSLLSDTSDDPDKAPLHCPVCRKEFKRKYHLDRHLQLTACSGGPPPAHPCQVCGRVYSRKDNLREHLKAHAGGKVRKKKYKCDHCSMRFHGLSLLTIHIRTHTGERPFECDVCNRRFPSHGALTKHNRTHTGEKPYSCPECGAKFSLRGTLNRHTRVHTGIRPHVCNFCGKQFIQAGGLKAHLFHHTGTDGFNCEHCGKTFNRKARLQMHIKYIHEKVKPFECSTCNKTFTRKEDLNRHLILHTGQKPYECNVCHKTFAIKPSLKLHLLTHTREEPRSCHECGRAFIRKDCLIRHMRKRHRDVLDRILSNEVEADKTNGQGEKILSSKTQIPILTEQALCSSIKELLGLLVDEPTLKRFGWPDQPVDKMLESVIKRCGHNPADSDSYSYYDRLRENAKLLFTVVIDDNAVKTLLNNQTVDEVILHVLRLAKA